MKPTTIKTASGLSAIALAAVIFTQVPAFAEDDDRAMLDLPKDKQVMLLKEMRENLELLDDLIGALGEGNLKEAIRITDYELGFGHSRFKKMKKDGVPADQIEAFRLKMVARRAAGEAHGGGGEGFAGIGRFMPPEMRDMGEMMHNAAADLSVTMKKIKGDPTAADYKALFSGVQDLTSTCRACHVSFKIR